MPRLFFASILVLFLQGIGLAATYTVGPTRSLKSLNSIADRLRAGDVVLVDGGVRYSGQITFRNSGTAANPITIRGVGATRPVLATSGTFVGGSVVRFWGHHYVFENFDVDGERSVNTMRGLHIVANDVTIRNCVVHDVSGIGIHGSDSAGSHTLDQVEVHHCGKGELAHQIYVATDNEYFLNAVFRMTGCYVHDGLGGSNLKSRAARSEIYGNWFEGGVYYEINLIGADAAAQPAGSADWVREDADVVGNVFIKHVSTFPTFAGIGSDGSGTSNGRYRFVNNTFIADAALPANTVFYLKGAVQTLEAFNNVFYSAVSAMRVAPTITIAQRPGSGTTGAANWAGGNVSAIPTAWTGTITSAHPGWQENLVPLANSALFDAGVTATWSPPGLDFPSPLLMPQIEPRGAARNINGAVDIGAFEAPLPDGTNTPPSPANDTFTTGSFATVSIPVLANDTDADGDTLQLVSVTRATYGAVSIVGNMITWKPTATFPGRETLRYAVSDGHSLAWAELRIVNPFVTSRGIFNGNLGSPGDGFTGALRIVVANTGAFTGALRINGVSYTLKGTLAADGHAALSIVRKNLPPLTLDLAMEFGPLSILRASVSDGTSTAAWEAPRVFYNGVRPAQTGVYTFLLTTSDGPPGIGYGALSISAAGAAKISGAIGDGRTYSATGDLRKDGSIPIYVPLYTPAGGGLFGTLTITGSAGAENITGSFAWWKPAGTTGLYPGGFSHTLDIAGNRWNIASFSPVNVTLTLSNGNLPGTVQCTASVPAIGLQNITDNGGGILRTFEIKRATGLYVGKIFHPLTAREIPIGGAILQPLGSGGGAFIGPTESGKTEIQIVTP